MSDRDPYKTIRLLYVTGPFEDMAQTRKYAVRLWELIGGARYAVFCPAFNNYQLEIDCMCDPREILERSLAFLDVADAVFLLPNWATSRRCTAERVRAMQLEKPIFQSLREAAAALQHWPDGSTHVAPASLQLTPEEVATRQEAIMTEQTQEMLGSGEVQS